MNADELQQTIAKLKPLLEELWPIVNDLARKFATAKGEEAAKTVNTIEDAVKTLRDLK